MDGLADYDREKGFVDGAVTLDYETMEMTRDRGRAFDIDEMDVDESNFIATAGNVMGEFQRLHVAPEVDAYRLSKINEYADTNSQTYTPAANSIFGALTDNIAAVQDKVGGSVPLVIHINGLILPMLMRSTEFMRTVSMMDFTRGEFKTKVRAIDDIPLLATQSRLMMTVYDFADGRAAGQESGGFAPKSDAVQINWLIIPRSAPIAPCKVDKVRTFSPEVYQKKRAWHTDYRRYFDLWMSEKKCEGLFANRKG